MDARLSRYSYLVSLLPRQVMADLDLDVRLVRRRYSSYTPLPSAPGPGLLVDNEDAAATAAAFAALTGSRASTRPVGPVLPAEAARPSGSFPRSWSRCGPPTPSASWSATTSCGGRWSSGRWGDAAPTFADDRVRGIVATDALIGTFADLDGAALAQNVCFLYHLIGGGTGDWDVPVGGMGAVTGGLDGWRAPPGRRCAPVPRSSVDPGGEVSCRAAGQGPRSALGASGVRGAPT